MSETPKHADDNQTTPATMQITNLQPCHTFYYFTHFRSNGACPIFKGKMQYEWRRPIHIEVRPQPRSPNRVDNDPSLIRWWNGQNRVFIRLVVNVGGFWEYLRLGDLATPCGSSRFCLMAVQWFDPISLLAVFS
jgi:hypothetical protein